MGQIQFCSFDRRCKTCLDTKPVLLPAAPKPALCLLTNRLCADPKPTAPKPALCLVQEQLCVVPKPAAPKPALCPRPTCRTNVYFNRRFSQVDMLAYKSNSSPELWLAKCPEMHLRHCKINGGKWPCPQQVAVWCKRYHFWGEHDVCCYGGAIEGACHHADRDDIIKCICKQRFDTLWNQNMRHRSGSLARVMIWCLTAASHYLHQCFYAHYRDYLALTQHQLTNLLLRAMFLKLYFQIYCYIF